ncbi:MAG: TIGR03986 family CRISPR-associated RAMP protein [Trichloromonas sp.]|jgi:CRISPR-associated protein (TIGR03986 family)|nr:TIGR03986 family CRISPR-associated RAMP protein [Trichloromonas sp.]
MNGKPYGKGQGQGGNRQQGKNQGGGGQGGQAIEKITAPYNFVPLSKKVFFPDWAGQVSHDVPFSDGISGELECELTTHTPIYVRNGGKWEHDDIMKKADAQSFFYVKVDGQKKFMIPGTSLKGMLRNVIEIASFGKMTKVDDHRYGVRDLTNPDKKLYLDHMTDTVGQRIYKSKVKAAWLRICPETEQWNLIPCSFARVEQADLVNYHPSRPEGIKKRISAVKKYELWGGNLDLQFDHNGEGDHRHSCGMLRYIRATNVGKGKIRGRLVFTGQPAENRRDVDPRNHSKHMEFIFFGEENCTLPVEENIKKIKKEFEFIHSDANEVPNEEWAYWKRKLAQGERVPVFYLTNKDGSLHSIGLAMMYRLPYKNSVLEAIRNTSPDHGHQSPDLAETLFGFVDGNRDALKGRVTFTAAIATQASQANAIQTVLGGPKPSYYPNYIEQPISLSGGTNYQTFMDDKCRIRGWKRYPVRLADAIQAPKGVTDNVDTKLIPLKEGARFVFRVKIHNLKPTELGAVAWALTWGNNAGMRHSLGMGKAIGYGVADIKIKNASLRDLADAVVDWQGCMNSFVELMDREVGGGWLKTAQMEQLLAMADPTVKPQCGELKHMELAKKDFQEAKKAKLRLEPHVKPTAISDDERFKNLKPRPVEKGQAKEQAEAHALTPAMTKIETVGETWTKVRLGYNRGQKLLSAQTTDGRKAEVQLIGSSADLVPEEVLNALAKGKNVEAQIDVEKLGSKWRITGFKRL